MILYIIAIKKAWDNPCQFWRMCLFGWVLKLVQHWISQH